MKRIKKKNSTSAEGVEKEENVCKRGFERWKERDRNVKWVPKNRKVIELVKNKTKKSNGEEQ
jgi:hypothetical protein